MSNSLGPDQERHSIQTVCKGYQQTTQVATGKVRAKESQNEIHAQIQRADLGSGPLFEYLKAIDFLRNTGLDPLENHKATQPAFNVGPSSPRQHYSGGSMKAHF